MSRKTQMRGGTSQKPTSDSYSTNAGTAVGMKSCVVKDKRTYMVERERFFVLLPLALH